ncbi:tRNA pseudouridine(38-40) synthase TruA [Spongiimicrobium salis]|uniref:tRNA pseudouridine(38-40) synthase TruA n=1 Tax=Spongiimicrobium salis TaxID=1667022 RepID=UPI00374D32CF
MNRKRFYYLVKLQFLGFRYSGWQKQPDRKTIEGMLTKTLKFILADTNFKILGAGRTDAKVSALDAAFELFIEDKPLQDLVLFKEIFNKNLPSDIKILSINEVNESFNIIHSSKKKKYVYLFSFGKKNHPFCAPYMTNVLDQLDIALMQEGAQLLTGTHNFRSFTARPRENTKVRRTIISAKIEENTMLRANFFPEKSYAFIVEGTGFMRYQIRMMMGALIQLGKRELSLTTIQTSLKEDSDIKFTYVAPGSGLHLHSLEFE